MRIVNCFVKVFPVEKINPSFGMQWTKGAREENKEKTTKSVKASGQKRTALVRSESMEGQRNKGRDRQRRFRWFPCVGGAERSWLQAGVVRY